MYQSSLYACITLYNLQINIYMHKWSRHEYIYIYMYIYIYVYMYIFINVYMYICI